MPKVTIGVPVFNGARFIERAVRCFLDQDFDNLEVIVADNASTDATLQICRSIASTDTRLRILTSDSNRGALPNYNRLLDHAAGTYFKWAAHDDWCTRDFVSAAVAALESQKEAVLCYAPMGIEDDSGRVHRWLDQRLPDLGSDDVWRRLHELIWNLRNPNPLIFGLMRTDILRRTGRLPNTSQPDRALLNELALHGPFLRVGAPRYIQYKSPTHYGHYADENVRPRLRSWVWLDAHNESKPKLSLYRFFRANFDALKRAPTLSAWNYCTITMEIFVGTLVTRVRSRRRLASRRRGGAGARMGRTGRSMPANE